MTLARAGAEECSSHVLELPKAAVDMSKIEDARDCIEAAKDPDLVASLEVTVTDWCKRIEVVRLSLLRNNRSVQCIKHISDEM